MGSRVKRQKTPMQWKEEGNEYFGKGQYLEASQCYHNGLVLDPDNTILLGNRCECFLRLEKFEEACIDIGRALKADSKNYKYIYRMLRCMIGLEQIDKAIACVATLRAITQFRGVLADHEQELVRYIEIINHICKQKQLSDGFIKQGQQYMSDCNYEEADKSLSKAIRCTRRNKWAYLLRAEARLHIPNHAHLAFTDTEEAEKCFWIENDALEAKIWKIRAQALCILQSISKYTMETLKKAVSLNPQDGALAELYDKTTSKPVVPSPQDMDPVAREIVEAMRFSFIPALPSMDPKREAEFLKVLFPNNPFLELRCCPDMGRAVFAKSDILQNQTLYNTSPIIAISTRDDVCQSCMKNLPSLDRASKCDGCGEEWYCNKECKEDAWNKYHKGICRRGIQALRKDLRENANSSSGKCHLMIIRYMGMIKSSPEWDKIKSDLDSLRVPELPDVEFLSPGHNHEDVLHNDSTIQYYHEVADSLGFAHDPYFDVKWYLQTARRISTNSFSNRDDIVQHPKTKGSRTELYRELSFFNHSCVPNAEVHGGRVVALKPIKKGEQVFISYGIYGTHEENRRRLEYTYGFVCKCERCTTITNN